MRDKSMRINSNDVVAPASSVSVYDAIFRRRNVKEFTGEPISDETLERLFSTAVWAPNHRMTEPTRFFAIRKDSAMRHKIAEVAWQTTYDGVVNPNPAQKQRSADASKERVLNAPAMVYVYSLTGDNEEVTQENYATSCCAVQNMALAAVAEGLYMDWSTGGLSKLPDLAQTLGADEDWTMVGVVFIGKATEVPNTQRMPHSEVVSWLE
jgi:nitroreductase